MLFTGISLPVQSFEPADKFAEARAIAKEAYIYGYPLVDSYRVSMSASSTKRQFVQGTVESTREHPQRIHTGRYGGSDTQFRHTLLVGWPRFACRTYSDFSAGN